LFRLNSYVICGYPEIVKEQGNELQKEHYYNSQLLVSRDGSFLRSYKKHNLYYIDEYWAEEGPNFDYIDLKNQLGQVIRIGFGICMDINPPHFQEPTKACQFANYHKNNNVDLIAFSSNWTDEKIEDQIEMNTINYWASRLSPLLNNQKVIYFIVANRIGIEKNTIFIGSIKRYFKYFENHKRI